MPYGVSPNGNGIAFSAADVLHHGTGGPLYTRDPITGVVLTTVSLVFPPPGNDRPRINAMDFHPQTDVLWASLNDKSGGVAENFLTTVDPATGIVTIVGQTQDGLDGLVWAPILDADFDGLSNRQELDLGTDPNVADTDGGGRTDGEEVLVDGTDPLDPGDDL